MYYRNKTTELFTFQLLHDDGKAHASVCFTDGLVTTIAATAEYSLRITALVRLAKKHLAMQRKRHAENRVA